ncbi:MULTISPECIES: hypothetical protein [unclassified Meridianimarinicoccus]|uniref:hypothetical protein n=1 Tax=unclassified Meridianimarinicoccus TaxID=2923344 RepID=UPI001865C031|nr:hypothetical protein [Fluviibacterium sp. MJW13]
MGLKKLAGRVEAYRDRVKQGKADKIKPQHVERVLDRLRRKEADLKDKLDHAHGSRDKDRLKRKLRVARKHIERAEWLLKEVA